ncbi:uncharacterized protein ARMOST_11393 [Armillaria ostoyae]|uniref:Uncharacterized protein n=1 Tax=Armillaria ostoyae TaxID=47428 RepID=A0A284RGZ8_ARMOS|nr:uncharacterized protein ARMOST_11393 [Armillaria ostoyae]
MSASTQKMPRPTSRDAPKFDSDEPENLRRFLGQMEDLFSDYSITDDDEKKKKLVRYTDARTEEEWQALDEYDSGTFAEFKEAVLKNYPEAADAETGTWERLTRIARKFSNLGADERESYLKFKRRFLTEAKKLQKPPALVTNRELVEKFTESLSPAFRENIAARLSIKRGIKSATSAPAAAPAAAAAAAAAGGGGGGAAAAPVVAKPVKRREDMHTLDEVVAEADDIALNSSTSYLLSATSGSISSTGATSGSGIKAEFEEVKQQVATLLDRIDVSEKQAKERQEQILRAFQQGGNNSSSLRQPRPQNEHSGAGPSDNCWYDWKPGHFVRDCQNVQKHVAEGLLKLVDRKFMMADGTPIPREPAHLCPMDRMLATLSKRQEQMFWEDVSGPAGVFNISLPDNASLYANKPRDARDEVIDKLRQDLQYWQTSTRVPTPVQPALQPQMLQAPVPSTSSQPMNQPFDPNVFLNQMRSLFSQAGNQNATSSQNFEGFRKGLMKATGKNMSIPMTIPHKQPEDHFKNRPKGTEPKKYVKKVTQPLSDESDESEKEEPVLRVPTSKKVVVEIPTTRPTSKKPVTVEDASDDEDGAPRRELPFRKVPSVSFAPLPSDSANKKKTQVRFDESKAPAYKHTAPIHKEGRVQDVASKVLKTPIVLNAEELMDLSEPLRKEIAKLMAKKRISTQPVTEQMYSAGETQPESDPLPFSETSDEEDATSKDLSLESDAIDIRDLPSATFMAAQFNIGLIPAGSLIMADPYLQYLDSLAPGEKPKQVIVAKDSASLRAVYPVINGAGEEESVVDGGSQIVSMASAIATKLGVAWDPDITIHMQSANGQLEKTLGLARNVPFLFNDITVYLQVHIIASPAYKVLLGRPFDVLTESVIRNQADGGQIITITDPNTSRRCTIPTFLRGGPPRVAKAAPKATEEGFHLNSMN